MVKVQRYVARTAREALAQVKAELGPDAVVLSNRQVADGVEIVAMPADEMGELNATLNQARKPVAPAPQAPASVARTASATPTDSDDFTVTLGQHIARLAREQNGGLKPRAAAQAPQPAAPRQAPVVRPFNPPRVNLHGEPIEDEPQYESVREVPRERVEERTQELVREPRRTAAQSFAELHQNQHGDPRGDSRAEPKNDSRGERRPAAAQGMDRDPQVAALEATNARLMDELGSIKGMLERQLAGFAWSEMSRNTPSRTQLMCELLEAGFSAELTRRLTEELSGDLPQTELRTQIKGRLNRHLPLLESDADIIDRGGVYALVGPTGVGKTTTTAKLAARCVVRHGADKLALVTTDSYRIGAHEQLRIYGRILGVSVHVVRDAADLRRTLQDLRNKHMVLIDTIGMSQRDKMVVEQASMLTSAGCVRRLLVLNATVRGDTLDDVVRAYDGPDLAGCILSKVDEAASLAPVLDVAIRNELQVFYVANGQRVPEDLHLPNRGYLVHRAMKEVAGDSPWKLDAANAGMLMATSKDSTKSRGASV